MAWKRARAAPAIAVRGPFGIDDLGRRVEFQNIELLDFPQAARRLSRRFSLSIP